MKTLFFALALLFSLSLYGQTTKETGFYYCVQVMSTENPELLKPVYFTMMHEQAMVEYATVNGRKYYRIIFIYNSIEDQDSALHNWKHQYKDAIRVTRSEAQIQKMTKLFTEN